MEITKREIIASVSVLAIMFILGIIVGGYYDDYYQDLHAKYHKAFKIKEDKDIFTYGMKTNIGHAFVEGELKAIDPVSHEDVEDEYLVLRRVKEKYTMHTRTVTTKVNGKTKTKTETYWTWDEVDRETYRAEEVNFLGVDFKASQFDLPATSYITTVSGGYHIRYKYCGLDKSFKATIFTQLKDNNIQESEVEVNRDKTIQEVLEEYTNNSHMLMFWFLWFVLTGLVVYLFVYLDNDWLNK